MCGSSNPISDLVNTVTSTVSDVGNAIQNNVITPISNLGVGIDQTVNQAVPGGWGTIGALGAAALTGGASLGLDAGLVASADATAAGLGYSSAAEAIQAGAITAEGLGLPASTTVADLAAVQGSASAGWAGLGVEPGVAGGVSAGATGTADTLAPGFVGPTGVTPDIAAANQAAQANAIYDASTPGFVGPTGVTPDVAAADQAAAAQAGYSPMQIAQAAKQGISVAKLLQGAGTALGIIPAASNLFSGGLKGTGATSATDPYAQYRPQAAAQLNQLMNQPSAALSLPGYQQTLTEGLKQAQRGAAATGQLQSGAEMAALQSQGQNVFGSYYNTLLGNLMQMSGASQNPASAQTAAQQIAASKQNMLNQNLGTLTSGIGSIASLYNSGGTSDPYANAQNAISQYGASNVYGYGGSGVAGSAAGIDPNVQQF